MQPLITSDTKSSDINKGRYWGRSLCIITALLFVVIIITVAFFGGHKLNNSNPAKNFIDKPDNNDAYKSTFEWQAPSEWKKPKPKLGPKTAKSAAGAADATDATDADDGTSTSESNDGDNDGDNNDSNDNTSNDDDDEEPAPEPKPEPKPEPEPEPEPEKPTYSKPKNPPNTLDDGSYTDIEDVLSRTIIPSDLTKTSKYYKKNGNDDLIEAMPFLLPATCSSSASSCSFNQYSGYLLANNNAEIHYWFIESETDPINKPIFFWTNGGPGCSGLDGLLTEHGPWKVYDNLKIHYNPHSWNTEVNMVYIEQPYGVGFSSISSISDDDNIDDNVVSGDQNAADDMDALIRNFLTKFPDYSNNEIYLSSESWGGHYVPITTYTILQNNDNNKTPFINLKGFLLGNPYTNFYENTYGFVGDIYGHGLMKSTDWDTWRESCWDNEDAIDNDATCSAIYSRAYWSSYNANVYALDYPQCYDDEDWDEFNNKFKETHIHDPWWIQDSHIHRSAKKFMERVLRHHDYDELKMNMDKSELQQLHDRIAERLAFIDQDDEELQQEPDTPQDIPQDKEQDATDNLGSVNNNKQSHNNVNNNNEREKKSSLNGLGASVHHNNNDHHKQQTKKDKTKEIAADTSDDYLPCIEYDMADYLNLEEVQDALHVKPTEWEMCSDVVWNAWPDTDYDKHVQHYYSEIIKKYSNDLNLKLTIYSGDDDSVCGLQGTQYWLDRWDYKSNPDMEWMSWEDNDTELGGFYTQYMGDKNNVVLHFITIRSAGHMVPTTQPKRALKILQKYLNEMETS